MSKLRAAVQRSRGLVKVSKKDLMQKAAKGFVKDVVAMTPPGSQGVTGSAAKKAGEGAIAVDVARIFKPTTDQGIEEFRALNGEEQVSDFGHKGAKPLGTVRAKILSFNQMAAWHAERRRRDGRVMQINRDVTTGLRRRDLLGLDIGIVAFSDFQRFIKVLQKNVGFLAGGWNAAAAKLQVNLPSWVKRHGTSGGNVVEMETDTKFRLELSNEVKFLPGVRDYERRVQKALDIQANKLNRQLDYLVKKALRAAGFR